MLRSGGEAGRVGVELGVDVVLPACSEVAPPHPVAARSARSPSAAVTVREFTVRRYWSPVIEVKGGTVDARSERLAKRFEIPMLVAAALVIPAIVLDEPGLGSPRS
jgi:hypothetical protein